MRLLPLLALVLAAVPAGAAPPVAVHPLLVDGDNATANEDCRSEFLSEAARQAIDMISRSEVEASIARFKGSCFHQEGCLEKLAADTGATYAVIATLDLRSPKFLMTAQVVASDGTVVRKIDSLVAEKDLLAARTPQVKALFHQLFTMLDLGALPAVLPKKQEVAVVTEPVAPVEAPPVVIAPAPAQRSSTNGLRVAGFVVGAAGVVAVAVGAGVAGIGASQAGAVPATEHAGKFYYASGADAMTAAQANGQASLGLGVLAGGAAAVAAGVVMIVLSLDDSPSVAAVPINGGAVVTFGGSF